MPKKNAAEHTGPIEAEGKTINDAIEQGLKTLNLPREKVEIKILDEGTSGLFGLMGAKSAKVQIQPKLTSDEKKEVPPEDSLAETGIKKIIRQRIEQMLELLPTDKPEEINLTEKDDHIQVNISIANSQDSALLIGRGGRTLIALETILHAMINHYLAKNAPDSARIKINLDLNDYHLREEKRIKDKVDDVANMVKKNHRPYSLDPMSPRTRRLVHIWLKNDPEVETSSEGQGEERKVVIRPKTTK